MLILDHMRTTEIAKLRKRIGWSQSQMARALGIANPITISHWETGDRNPSGSTIRFLELLDEMSDSELKKIVSRLERLGGLPERRDS